MLTVETELEDPIATLFLRALECEAQAEGFRPHFHFREPGGSNVHEFRRAQELMIIKSRDAQDRRVNINVESETFDVGPLVERAAGRAAADVLSAVMDALGEALGDEARAKLRQEMDHLLARHA
jgi:hypothetical protein